MSVPVVIKAGACGGTCGAESQPPEEIISFHATKLWELSGNRVVDEDNNKRTAGEVT